MKEIIGYVLSFIFVIFMTLGLFGAFDKDKDNPFINKKQSGGGIGRRYIDSQLQL